ncbi:MAG: tRNA (N6-threonylcarbamoyladenosine(37)-N6)-methyltransferase TrmO [Candidatus Thorarchaeota archaeon]
MFLEPIEVKPIAFVQRESPEENDRNLNLVSRIVFKEDVVPGLEGIEEFSHIFIIFWLHKVKDSDKILVHPGASSDQPVGIFATRAPVRPNPIGLTVVDVVKRKGDTLWVRGLDAIDGTPVLDIKPYPDWANGRLQVISDFKIPFWLQEKIR